jgi:hypothetical protein
MIRASKRVRSEDDASGGLASFASISDLMTALLAVFVLATAVLLVRVTALNAEIRAVQTLLAKREIELSDARRKNASETAARPSEPGGSASMQEAWGLTLAEFERRQLAARVRVAWEKVFAKIPGVVPPAGNTIVLHLTQPSGRVSASLPFAVVPAQVRDAVRRTFLTNWASFNSGAGCGLGVAPDMKLFVTTPHQNDFTSSVALHQLFASLVAEEFPSHKIGFGTELSPYSAVRLLVSFVLLPESKERLRARFQRGPDAGPIHRLWCD